MKNKDLLIYRIVTGVFSAFLLTGSIMYFVKYEVVSEMFTSLGVPTEIIYPLAIAKILGLIAIWFIKSPLLKNLAYLGFGLDLLLAIGSHLNAGHGSAFGPVIPLVLLIISYIYLRKLRQKA